MFEVPDLLFPVIDPLTGSLRLRYPMSGLTLRMQPSMRHVASVGAPWGDSMIYIVGVASQSLLPRSLRDEPDTAQTF